MRIKNWSNPLVMAALLGMASASHAQFTAVNDYAPGPGTSANATSYDVFGNLGPSSGPLKDINTGQTLGVTLTLTRVGQVTPEIFGATPATGTPLNSAFAGYVDWANNSANNNINVGLSAYVTNTFSGLNPTHTYIVQGGAARGNPNGTNSWSLFSIVGADDYMAAHSGGLTSAQVPADIAANQVAINTGRNNLANEGAMFEWQEINPGADGIIHIVTSRYTGAVPGGTSVGGGSPRGYGPTAIKLIDAVEAPPTILTQPSSGVVSSLGQTVTFEVVATGFPLNYQWYRNGVLLNGRTSPQLTFAASGNDVGASFTVRVSNNLGTVESDTVTVIILGSPIQVLPYNHVWRYDRSGSNLGTSWRDLDFGDATWPSGPGPLGFPMGEATPVAIATTFATHNNITYYFRTTFSFTNEPTDYEMWFTNFVDDGAIFYLNNQEVVRDEMPASPPPVDYVTPAASGDEWVLRAWRVPTEHLVKGTNHLAVEVHQINTTSSDAILGLNIWAFPLPPGPLTLTQQPQDLAVEELKEAVFSVELTGNGARFQWMKDGIDIPGATSRTLVIPEASASDEGEYSVRVMNTFSSLVSDTANLVVIPDVTAPVLLEADGSLNTTNVLVLFSEKITESQATTASNYRLTTADMATDLSISSLVYTNDGTAVLLTTQARLPNINYILIVNNLTDVSMQANEIEPNSAVPVIREIELIGWYATWDIYDPFPLFGEPRDPGMGWQDPSFNSAPWADGTLPAVYNAPNNELPIAPAGLYFSLTQGAVTKFFRTKFNYQASLLGATFRMQHMVDDGIIAYLNGQEFHRFNMPAGAVTPTTPAAVAVGAAALVDVSNVPTDDLVLGTNTMAVELHGTDDVDLDWVFGMNFKVRIQSYATGPVVILKQPSDQTIMAGQTVTFSFVGVAPSSYTWRTNGVNVPNSNSPTLTLAGVPLALDGLNVSVVAVNGFSSTTSSNAVLTVLPDNLRPELVAGHASDTRDSITLTFNEWIDPVSGGDAANYVVTDAVGGSFNVTSAMVVDNTNVVLQTASYNPLNLVKVTVNDVMDIASVPNTILPDSAVIIGFDAVLLDRHATWDFNDTGTDLYTAGQWTSLGYDPEVWGEGPATLIARNADPDQEPLPAGWDFMTPMTYGNIAYYFRHIFNVPQDIMGTITASNLIDDGAVFYLNGQEIERIRLPAGPIASTTEAGLRGDVNNAPIWDVFSFDAAELLAGDNVLAVGVHQDAPGSSDLVFACELFLRADPILIPGLPADCEDPVIAYDDDANEVVITWPGNCVLVQADNVLGPYTVVTGATSPYRVAPSAMKRFYQTRSP